jgi:hypothetical protein
MINVKATFNNNQKIKDYFKKHSKGLKVSIGFFGNKNKRKEVIENGLKINSVYGLKKSLSKKKSNITNSYVAKKNIEGSTFISKQGNEITIPSRNFFLVASDKKYWQSANFDFLRDFYKTIRNDDKVYNRLGNLGTVILKRAVADSSKYQPNTDFTQEIKGSSKPLIDSGQMLDGLGWKKFNF